MAGKGTFKLVYFNGSGRAEGIRWILSYAKVPFEDKRLSFQEWGATEKAKAPLGVLPMLEWTSPDGKQKMTLSQSSAISRHLAINLNLYPKNPAEQAKAEEAFECMIDIREPLFRAFFEKDEAKKGELMGKVKTETGPRILGFLEKKLKENGGKSFSGGDISFADLAISSFINMLTEMPAQALDLSVCPGVVAHAKKLADNPEIKAYLAKRPKPDF